MQTFAQKFCQDNHIDPENYEAEILKRVLYPRAALIQNLLALIPGYFEADRELVQGVGRLTDIKGYNNEEMDFNQHSANRGFMRQTLDLRVSARRMKKLVHATLGPSPQ